MPPPGIHFETENSDGQCNTDNEYSDEGGAFAHYYINLSLAIM